MLQAYLSGSHLWQGHGITSKVTPVNHDAVTRKSILGVVRLLRPTQWTKNGFVLAGFIFARHWNDSTLLTSALLAFVAFCAAASAAYVLNDWHDIEADRNHPVKRFRPLASGDVTPRTAAVVAIVMLCVATISSLAAGPGAFAAVMAYLVLNAAYSQFLKHVVIADVFTVAAGFMLRLLAGTAGIGIPPSSWLLLTGLFLTLFLGFAKRRAEWTDSLDASARSKRRKVMQDYSAPLLDTFLSVTATASILSYGLYTVDPEIQQLHGTSDLVYTVPLVTFAVFRYLYLVHSRGQGENPSRDLFVDPQVLLCAVAWVITSVTLIN